MLTIPNLKFVHFYILSIDEYPNKYPADVWDDNSTEWPSLQYHHVYHHLIKSLRVFSNEAIENYKSLVAYQFFVSGWVQTVKHMV